VHLALVLMLVNFHILGQKLFVSRAFLQRKEKGASYAGKCIFFSQEGLPNRKFLS
jgi:hypothetical protein